MSSKNHKEDLKPATSPADDLWEPTWKESYGEFTIQKRSTQHERKLFCGWYCPFAQRAWIALEELGLPYQYVECNPYEVDPTLPGGYTKKALSLSKKKELMPEFIAASPRGLVPALQDVTKKGEGSDDPIRVWESSAILEYLDETYGPGKLMPMDPHARALVRIFVDHCTGRIQKAYYTWLMEQSVVGQQKAKDDFFSECRVLAAAMAPTSSSSSNKTGCIPVSDRSRMDLEAVLSIAKTVHEKNGGTGPFFLGEAISAVDISLAPFWQRFIWVGGHYRDLEFPSNDPAFERLASWWDAVSQHPSILATLVCKERLISSYGQYARNEGTSDCAMSLQSILSKQTSNTVTTTTS